MGHVLLHPAVTRRSRRKKRLPRVQHLFNGAASSSLQPVLQAVLVNVDPSADALVSNLVA